MPRQSTSLLSEATWGSLAQKGCDSISHLPTNGLVTCLFYQTLPGTHPSKCFMLLGMGLQG